MYKLGREERERREMGNDLLMGGNGTIFITIAKGFVLTFA